MGADGPAHSGCPTTLRVVGPVMPAAFVIVWLGVFVCCGALGWKTQREGWFLAAFAWLLFVGPVCWLMVGAAGS